MGKKEEVKYMKVKYIGEGEYVKVGIGDIVVGDFFAQQTCEIVDAFAEALLSLYPYLFEKVEEGAEG